MISVVIAIEIEGVERFREETLERAGYPAPLAAELAARMYSGRDDFADLHLACDLIARGCEPELAARIV